LERLAEPAEPLSRSPETGNLNSLRKKTAGRFTGRRLSSMDR
jgi:hypothetical protein